MTRRRHARKTPSQKTPNMSSHPILNQHYSRFLGPNPPSPHSTYTPSDSPIFHSPFGPFPPSPPRLNIHSLCFPPSAPLPPDYPLIINAATGVSLSLHAFYARVCALARALHPNGPNPLRLRRSPRSDTDDGDIVGLLSRNHIHYPGVVHACLRAGVVFGGISPASTPYELWVVLRRMQVSALVVHESLLGVVREAVGFGTGEGDAVGLRLVLDMSKVVVLSEDLAREEVGGHRTVESLVREGMEMSEVVDAEEVGGDDLAYLFQSSGTSGLPKAMMITHSNGYHSGIQTLTTATQTALFAGVEPFATPGVTLGVVPMYHSYGMILWNLRVNLVRNTTILLPSWSVEAALAAIQRYRITALPLVPPLVRQLALSPLTAKYDLSSVVAAVSGAAYLPPDVAVQLAQKLSQGAAAPVPSGYGLSEAASIASPVAPGLFGLESCVGQHEPAREGSCIGYLLPGMSGRVVDASTGADVARGEKGELWVRGAVVTPGYFRDADATAELFPQPGWLRTGDLVMRDGHDRVFYLDRLKELIKVKGLQVAATEVEDTLLQHPQALVRDACVAGVDNGRGDGSVFVRAWVVLSETGKTVGEEKVGDMLRSWVEGRLSRYKWLTGGVEVVEEVSECAVVSRFSSWGVRVLISDRFHGRPAARCSGGRCGIGITRGLSAKRRRSCDVLQDVPCGGNRGMLYQTTSESLSPDLTVPTSPLSLQSNPSAQILQHCVPITRDTERRSQPDVSGVKSRLLRRRQWSLVEEASSQMISFPSLTPRKSIGRVSQSSLPSACTSCGRYVCFVTRPAFHG